MSGAEHPPIPQAKRIAYLLADGGVPYFDSQKGASIHARSLVRAFEQEGCRVNVFAVRQGRGRPAGFACEQTGKSRLTQWYLARVLEEGLFCKPFASRETRRLARANYAPPAWMTALGILLWQRDFYRAVRNACRDARPDLLYARNAWFGFAYARLKKALGAPLILEVNAVCTLERAMRRQNAFDWLSRRIERRALREADLILPVTLELKRQVLDFCPGLDERKVVVTPNAVDLDLFHPREPRALRAADDEFVVGCVHSFKAYHGMEVLLETAAILRERIPRLRLLLIGGGEELEPTRRRAEAMGLKDVVEFSGVVAHSLVPDWLRRCDVCVAPYVGEQNLYGCPMKLYEYMAVKAPIVSAAWGDIPNTLTDGATARLHRVGDAGDLAAKLYETWRDPQAAARMAEAAYELARGQTWRATARKILDWAEGRPIADTVLAPRAAKGNLGPDAAAAKDRAPGTFKALSKAVEERAKPSAFSTSPFFRAVFDWLLWALFRLFAPKRPERRAKRGKGPIQALRLAASVAQGGVAKVVVQTVRAIPESEARTDIVSFAGAYETPKALAEAPGARVICQRLDLYPSDYHWSMFGDIWKLARTIRRLRPDVLHVHEPQFAPPAAIAAGLAGSPAICVHLHSVYQGRRRSHSAPLVELEREALRRYSLIACSDTIRRGAVRWIGKTARPIAMIEDGADDVLPYEPDQALIEEVSQAAQGRIVVVKMARLVTLKRIPLFLQACRILLDEGYPLYVALMCYGKDRHKPPIASQFERLFAPAEGRMLYEVRCPLSILKRADLGVTASALEGLGLNVLEYQAEGVAVVCSNIPAHREMVRDGETGYMFETDDLPDLVRTMKRALDNPEARQEIGERGRKAAMRRRWSRSAAATVELYRKLLSP